MAYLLMKGADQNKYGTLTKGLTSQFSMGNDQYPRTIQAATDILSNHKLDAKYYEVKKKRREQQQKEKNKNNNNDGSEINLAQGRGRGNGERPPLICYCCGKAGHASTTCPKVNDIPRNQWAVNRGMSQLQEEETNENDSEPADDANRRSDGNSRRGRSTSRPPGNNSHSRNADGGNES